MALLGASGKRLGGLLKECFAHTGRQLRPENYEWQRSPVSAVSGLRLPVGPLEIRHNYLDLSNAEVSRTFTVLSPLPTC